MKIYLLNAAVVIALVAAGSAPVDAIANSRDEPRFDTTIIDNSIDPGRDFYRFASGVWLDNTSIPDDRSSLSGANVAAVSMQAILSELIADSTDPEPRAGTPAARIATLYKAYLEGDGYAPQAQRAVDVGIPAIQNLGTRSDVARFMADPFSNSIVGVYLWIDAKNPSRRELTIDQEFFHEGALGMGNRAAYLDPDNEKKLAAYRNYVAATLGQVGLDNAEARADAVLAFEKEIAEAMWTQELMRDREANYNAMSYTELEEFAPGFSWDCFLDANGIDNPQFVILRQDTAVKAAARIFGETSLPVLKDYLSFHWVNNHWPYLESDLRGLAERYRYGSGGSGQSRSPTESRAMSIVSEYLGDDLSKLWVSANLSDEQMLQAEALGAEMISATEHWLRTAEWLDEETRQKSLQKLAGFTLKLGAPTVYRTLPEGAVTDDLYVSVRNLKLAGVDYDFDEIGTPLPPQYWYGIKPFTVDAANSPDQRALTISAPVIDGAINARDPAVVYSSAFVIGHEIGHSFDDQGSKFDPDGILQPWWSVAAREAYEAEVAKLASQIAEWEPIPGATMKPERVMGETIGDLIGLRIAETALNRYLAEHPEESGPDASGYTAKQRFFISYAQGFRTVWKSGALREYIQTQYHPPGEFRANGILRNLDGWYEAFSIGSEDPLYLPPEKRARF